MKIFVFFLTIFLSIALQSSLLPFKSLKPDLLLLLTVFISLMKGPAAGVKSGFVIGLIEDLFSGRYLGLSVVTKMTVGFLSGLLAQKLFKENYLIPVLALFLGTIVHELLFVLYANFIGVDLVWTENIWTMILPLALYHGILAPFFYVPFYKIYVSEWFNGKR